MSYHVDALGHAARLGWEWERRYEGKMVFTSPSGDMELRPFGQIADVRVRVGSKWGMWEDIDHAEAIRRMDAHIAAGAQGDLDLGRAS